MPGVRSSTTGAEVGVDMKQKAWYNIHRNGLLTQANKLRQYRSPLWGASVPMAIPIQSQGGDLPGEEAPRSPREGFFTFLEGFI